MNERKPTWNCPVCDKPAVYDSLVIDGYFQDVLNSPKLLHEVNEIQLLQDGSWENLVPKKEKDKEKPDVESSQRKVDINVTVDLGRLITLDWLCCWRSIMHCLWLFGIDESNPAPTSVQGEKRRAEVIDLISDSEEDEPAPSRAVKRGASPVPGKPVKTQPTSTYNVISSTSESPELMIIDLD